MYRFLAPIGHLGRPAVIVGHSVSSLVVRFMTFSPEEPGHTLTRIDYSK